MNSAWLLQRLADLLVLIHLVWVGFMVGGVVVTAVGLFYHRLLGGRWWRHIHLFGMASAGVLSLGGWLCPLTTLEYRLRRAAGDYAEPEGLIIRLANRLIFPDLAPRALAAVTVTAFVLVIAVYVLLPPGRKSGRQIESSEGS